MKAIFIDDFGTTTAREATREQMEEWNKSIEAQGLEEYGHWVTEEDINHDRRRS